jgi:hypothetical protein
MANYVKATNFFAKDALLTGDPAKIIKGAEIDDEFNAISTSIATKANLNSPEFTGVPIAPTAAFGTSTTQVATTKFVQDSTGTIALQNANNVAITGGTITGITDLAVADGGTGSSTLTANNVLLGNGTSPVNFVAPGTSGNILTSNGTTWESSNNRAVTNTGGTAPFFAARAWVNFNGTGVVAIRDSGNVSSITDNGTGSYTINFTTSMPDENYAISGSAAGGGTDANGNVLGRQLSITQTTTSCNVRTINLANQATAVVDSTQVHVAIFR